MIYVYVNPKVSGRDLIRQKPQSHSRAYEQTAQAVVFPSVLQPFHQTN